jgi:hypothetical protein
VVVCFVAWSSVRCIWRSRPGETWQSIVTVSLAIRDRYWEGPITKRNSKKPSKGIQAKNNTYSGKEQTWYAPEDHPTVAEQIVIFSRNKKVGVRRQHFQSSLAGWEDEWYESCDEQYSSNRRATV